MAAKKSRVPKDLVVTQWPFSKEQAQKNYWRLRQERRHRGHPLVVNFKNPDAAAFYQKTDDLRKFIVRECRKHADFRDMVNLALAKMQSRAKAVQIQNRQKGSERKDRNQSRRKDNEGRAV